MKTTRTYHLDGYLPTPIRIPEWDIELRHTSSSDDDVEAFTGTLDLGIPGWANARVTYERYAAHVGMERERYALEVGALRVRSEWHEPGIAALNEVMDAIERDMPRVDLALKHIEGLAAMRREHAKTHEDDERAYREEGVRT